MNFNRVFFGGYLTRDPELRYSGGGLAICGFGLAVNTSTGQGADKKEEVLFIDITAFGRQAETASEYLSKGRPALVEGRLQLRSWESQDGQKRTKHSVIAERIQFLGQREDRQESRPPATTTKTRGGTQGGVTWATPEDDDEVPFITCEREDGLSRHERRKFFA